MSDLKIKKSSPLTFDVGLELYKNLPGLQKTFGFASCSDLVRYALQAFNFNNFVSLKRTQKQLSVRLPHELKLALVKLSRDKNVSIGELLRVALEALQDVTWQNKKRSKPMVTKVTKKTTKPAAAAKKVVKKATTTAKAPAKKTPVKKVAAKAPAKKTAVKKVVKKATTAVKAPAKKAPAKKTVVAKKK